MWATWHRWRANRAFYRGDLGRSAALLKVANRAGQPCDRRLAGKLARALSKRAEGHIAAGRLSNAWIDLSQASEVALEADQDWLSRHKHRLVELTIESADSLLQAGKINQALQLVQELECRNVLDWRADRIAKTARLIRNADDAASQGHVRLSREQLERARNLRPDLGLLDARRRACEHRASQLKTLTATLRKALLREDWDEVERTCSEILLIAPNYQIAIDASRQMEAHRRRAAAEPDVRPTIAACTTDDVGELSQRFILWVDSVGGFLVCYGPRTTIGCCVTHTQVDIPVMADLKRVHARFDRADGGFEIVPLTRDGTVMVDGKAVGEPTPLLSGQSIQLGGGVQWGYQQPHPLSASARINFQSRHRTQPWTDGVLLMADTIILGKNPKNHVWCPDWLADMVIFPCEGHWSCRYPGTFQVDGKTVREEAGFEMNSRIVGPNFSLSVEALGERVT